MTRPLTCGTTVVNKEKGTRVSAFVLRISCCLTGGRHGYLFENVFVSSGNMSGMAAFVHSAVTD
eukprot:4549630-Amphidinium_carterae.1